jgi:hypothetical protein
VTETAVPGLTAVPAVESPQIAPMASRQLILLPGTARGPAIRAATLGIRRLPGRQRGHHHLLSLVTTR